MRLLSLKSVCKCIHCSPPLCTRGIDLNESVCRYNVVGLKSLNITQPLEMQIVKRVFGMHSKIFRYFSITVVTSSSNNLKDLLVNLKDKVEEKGNRAFIKYDAKVVTNVI